MDWKLAVKEERAALKRMVALLFALADLAESASRRSGIVRRFVSWLLRQAETVAWNFVLGEEPPPALMQVVGDSSAEALRLAKCFRDLARELDCQATFAFAVRDDMYDSVGQAEPSWLGSRRKCGVYDRLNTLRRFAVPAFAVHMACATGPPDTS